MIWEMAEQGWDELFTDGWREPGDDCERAMFYIIVAIELAMGLGMLG
jgi:hypothetical protein